VVDAATYSASLEWSVGATLTAAQDSLHRFVLAAKDVDRLKFSSPYNASS
jgi:hypothetical protein